jgi:hypothetical protein
MSVISMQGTFSRLAGAILVAAVMAGCTDTPFEPQPGPNQPIEPRVAQVVLGWQPRPATLPDFAIGETYRLLAVAADSTGAPINRIITWSSSQPSVASVDADGLVTMHAEGVAVITAAAGYRTATFEARVLPVATRLGSFRMTALDGQALPAQLSAWHGGDQSGQTVARAGSLELRADWTYAQTLAVDVHRNGAFHYDFVWEDSGQYRIAGDEIVLTSTSGPDRVVRGTHGGDSLGIDDTVGGNLTPQRFAYERN